MVVNLQNASYNYDEEIGMFVNSNHKRVADLLTEFDPNLVVLWEPSRRNYAVAHLTAERTEPYILFTVPEDEMDARVLHRVMEMHAQASGKQGTLMEQIERREAAERLVQLKREQEEWEIAHDKAAFLWNTPLHNPTMDGKVYRS